MQETRARGALGFEFRGSTREYFGVWLRTGLLTVVTLGVYSAWSKVRRKRYLYANTLFAGQPFA